MTLQQVKTQPYINIEEIELSHLRENGQFVRSDLGDISGLANSISYHGLVAPIVVRKANKNERIDSDEEFEIISGHRRFEALKKIGMTHAPCTIVDSSDKDAFELGLVENLQRKTLNPLEEALSFAYYIRVCKWGHAKSLARKIGKSVEYIHHRLKLLELPESVLRLVGNELTPSQAEELVWLEDSEIQTRLANLAVKDELTVRRLHEIAMQEKSNKLSGIDQVSEPLEQGIDDSSTWLPVIKKNKRPAPKQILENNVTALRFALSFMDNSIDAVQKMEVQEQLLEFMIEQRYTLHQILDSLITRIGHLEITDH